MNPECVPKVFLSKEREASIPDYVNDDEFAPKERQRDKSLIIS